VEKIKLANFLKYSKDDLRGKVVCFPTDTVYGLGAMYGDHSAIQKIYKIKNRPADKPLANLCSHIDQILNLGIEIPESAQELMKKYWPGALTIILKAREEKISFRMPNCDIALKLIDHFSLMATTSVNESGEKELNTMEDIEAAFGSLIDYFITDEAIFSKIPSTVIDMSEGKIIVLRRGAINLE